MYGVSGGEFRGHEQVLLDYFLFTIIGVIVTPEETTVFSFGDGVYAMNEDVQVIEQYEG
jgi:hypothetical protein